MKSTYLAMTSVLWNPVLWTKFGVGTVTPESFALSITVG